MGKDEVTLPEVAPSDYTNTSRLIHSGPCIVKAVHCAADGDNVWCKIYDGLNTSGKLKAFIKCAEDFSYTWRPGDGTDFDFGIYIEVVSDKAMVTVTYIPESRKAFI